VRHDGNESPMRHNVQPSFCALLPAFRSTNKPGSAANMLANTGHKTSDGKLDVVLVCRVD